MIFFSEWRPALTRLLLIFLVVPVVAACQSEEPADSQPEALLLISFDGFRADFLDRYSTPNLDRMIKNGVVADTGMIPAFPTLTFPNHYTIATGLYPANHGIISNTMYDEPTDSWFRISDREAVENTMWWEGEPIWVTAEKQGLTSATFYWVGSEAPVQGIQPTYWKRFDASVPGNERVDQVLEWLDLPSPERPAFVAFYFEDVDSVVHRNGLDSPETAAAVARVDAYLGRLMDGLKERGLLRTTNIIVVADHGMADRSADRAIVLGDYIDLGDVDVINTSPVAMMNAARGSAEDIVAALQGRHPALDVYLRENMPADLHFSGHYRIPEIIAIADEGWTIFRDRAWYEENKHRTKGATHGYRPELLSMRALFAAGGPSFKSGLRIDPFENVHIYPLMAHILKLDPADNDGDLSVLESVLQSR